MENNKRMRLTLTELYMAVICIFPLPTMLAEGGIINKLLFALLIGLQVAMLFDRKIKGRTFIMILVLALNFTYVFIRTRFPMNNSNLLFYFPFYLVYTYFMCDNADTVMSWFIKRKKFVTAVVIIWTAMVGVSVFLPSSYYVKEGGARYFGSFVGTIFRLGPTAVFIQVMAILMRILYGNKKAIWFHLLPMYSYFMGSSRSYLIVGVCLILVAWYLCCSHPAKFYLSLIPMAVVGVILISVTAMGEKIAYTLDPEAYGDFWFKITSSRSLIWDFIMEAWRLKVKPLSKLLGADLNFSYIIIGHWAHNDFMEILGSFGLLGLAQYLVSIFLLFKPQKKKKRMPFMIALMLLIAWLFNAFFNMHYVYFCAMLSYPLLVLALKRFAAEGGFSRVDKSRQSENVIAQTEENSGALYPMRQWNVK